MCDELWRINVEKREAGSAETGHVAVSYELTSPVRATTNCDL